MSLEASRTEARRGPRRGGGGECLVYFITIPDLLDQLADLQENRLAEPLRSLRHPTLLILDEMGYLPLDQVATSFLFQLVSKRYTKGSIIVTSNKSYAEWGSVFGDDVAAAAVIDRLLHYSTTVKHPRRELPAQGQEASRRLLDPSGQAGLLSPTPGAFQTVDR